MGEEYKPNTGRGKGGTLRRWPALQRAERYIGRGSS